jgi:Double-GTPase 2
MKFSRKFLFFVLMTLVLLTFIITISVFVSNYGNTLLELKNTNLWEALLFLLSIGSLIFGFFNIFELSNRHPQSLTLALIGPSGSGKTVYLTMLYKELEAGNLKGLMFSSYGVDTTKKVAELLNLLASGFFPPRTYIGDHFLYQAVAKYGTKIFSRRYRVQIADYAGEYLNLDDQYIEQENKWFQDTDFFKYVISSDSILIMIDYPRLISGTNALAKLQNILVASLTSLIETKNTVDPSLPLSTPVGIVISQMDMDPIFREDHTPNAETQMEIRKILDRLITFCEIRCKHFRIFYVSSIGSPILQQWIDKKAHPINITDPILWILGAG